MQQEPEREERRDRLAGTLLGTALGDALGLPAEGMSSRAVARRFGRVETFHLWGSTGFVSDDTELSALVAQSLALHPRDPDACVRAFRHALLGWGARLPWGVGLATLRACGRIALGRSRSGVMSAGNGAAMRSAIVGAFFAHDPTSRRRFGAALAEATHVDRRAVEGALFVAEVAAAGCGQRGARSPMACFDAAAASVQEPSLAEALRRARELARAQAPTAEAAAALGTTGFVVHTVPFAAFCFVRHSGEPLTPIVEAISAGGDTDSIAAIVGAWTGALHGAAALPGHLVGRIHDGPFGPSHLRALAQALADQAQAGVATRVRYSAVAAMARNLALYPVVLGHGFRRLLP